MKGYHPSEDDIKPREIRIHFDELSPNWRKAICAAEALSFVCRLNEEEKGASAAQKKRALQRLRLTFGNGHGISRILGYFEQGEQNPNDERLKLTFPKGSVQEFWANTLVEALKQVQKKEPHPSLNAVANEVMKTSGKVLVFGFYKDPMHDLADLINVQHFAREWMDWKTSKKPLQRGAASEDAGLSDGEKNTLTFLRRTDRSLPTVRELDQFVREFAPDKPAVVYEGKTSDADRHGIQVEFNSPGFPRVLIAQVQLAAEGLNLHQNCKNIIFLHPRWNPRVLEQGIGRVNRIDCLWERDYRKYLAGQRKTKPEISVKEVIFEGTYDEENWRVLKRRWKQMRTLLNENLLDPKQVLMGSGR